MYYSYARPDSLYMTCLLTSTYMSAYRYRTSSGQLARSRPFRLSGQPISVNRHHINLRPRSDRPRHGLGTLGIVTQIDTILQLPSPMSHADPFGRELGFLHGSSSEVRMSSHVPPHAEEALARQTPSGGRRGDAASRDIDQVSSKTGHDGIGNPGTGGSHTHHSGLLRR